MSRGALTRTGQLVCHLRRLVFDQRSPVHPISESMGGSLSVPHERTEILVSNIVFGCDCLTWIHSEWPPSPPCAKCGTGTD